MNARRWKLDVKTVVVLILLTVTSVITGANLVGNVDLENKISTIEKRIEIPVNTSLCAFRKSNSYIISLAGTYAQLQNGSNGKVQESSKNHTLIIQDALGNASVAGGSVYVAEGSYAASIILQNNTRLVIDRGATGITYTVAPGANCILDDFENGLTEYFNGNAVSAFNYRAGTFLTTSANLTTVYVGTVDSITGNAVKILKLVVETGTAFPASPSQGYLFYRTDLNELTFYNGSAWNPCLTGGSGQSGDLTVYLLTDGTRALTGDWNVGESYGIYGCTWLNSTSFAGQGQLWWNGLNRTDVLASPLLPESYIVYNDGNSYFAKNGASGQVDFASTNASYVINNVIRSASNGQRILIKSGNYTLDAPIAIPYATSINIEGEAVGDPRAGAYPSNGTILIYSGPDYAIESTGWAGIGHQGHWMLENLYIACQHYNGQGNGIKIEGVSTGAFTNIIVANGALFSGTVGFLLNSSNSEHFVLNEVEVSGFDKGFDISAPHLTFIACHTYACNYGYYHEDYQGMDTTYINCQAESSTYRAWRIYHDHVTLINPDVEGITSSTGIGIEVLGGYDDRTIINPYFTDLTSGAVPFRLTFGVEVIGPAYQNSGSVTNSTATAFVFDHNLFATPTGVWASFNTTAITGWTWAANVTSVTITVTGASLPSSMTCYWNAQYKP